MRVHTEPPLGDWTRLAGGKPVVTGHQPWLWHPGILAKYLAADAAMAASLPGVPLRHVIVDQDVQDALRLALPVREGEQLDVHQSRLGPGRVDVPTGCQPAVPLSLDQVPKGVAADVSAIKIPLLRSGRHEVPRVANTKNQRGALRAARYAEEATLAAQMTAVLHDLMQPLINRPAEAFYATRFDREPWFAEEVSRLLHDAAACVEHYNQAARANPEAGIAPLSVEPYRVELPLWKLGWLRPRDRVFADLADSTPLFTTADGEPFDPDDDGVTVAPRALLMTAWIRRQPDVGLFVHGTGGWRYDRITEAWWRAWRGETLCPMAVATADLTLDFDVPVNGRDAVTREVWQAHHRPHNLDRYLPPEVAGSLAHEKRRLLEHMDDDRDKRRRRAAFRRIHAINAELAARHPGALLAAETDLRRARVGLHNAAVAAKRDWCFALYPDAELAALRQTVRVPAHDS